MQLPKEQFQKLFEALIDAFEGDNSLRELARTASNRHLDRITTASGTDNKLRELIECAEDENWVGKLITTARELRPAHTKLAQFCQELQTSVEELERLDREAQAQAVCQFLKAIGDEFKYVPIFHPPHKIVLQDHYIPIEVTLERRYRHTVETTWSYAEGEAEFARAYAMKGFEEQKEETRRVQVPWQEARKQHKRLIVLADPGMGKTALLKMEAVTIAQTSLGAQTSCLHNSPPGRGKGWISEVEVPLFFRLSEFVDTDEEITETIPRLLQRNYPDIAPTILPLITEKLKNGTCLLLLDALDEVPQEQRNRLSDKLNRFARHYPCPIIVTSRIVGYGGGILHDAKEVEIVPFTRKRIDQYIEIWFKNAESSLKDSRSFENSGSLPDAKGLIHELQQKPQIRGLAQNPLLLSLLCSLYQEDELTLPARRVQIYEQAVHYMLYDWRRVSQRRLTEQALTGAAWIEAKLDVLEQLAYQFSCEYKEVFSMRELLAKIEECKGGTVLKNHESPDIIKELSQEDGIIQQLDGQGHNARYIFLHRTFQEYLTASYLKRQKNGIELAKAHFWDFDWHETLILFAGLAKDPERFLKALLKKRDDIFHTLLLLAGKCLAECPQLDMPKLVDRLYNLWRAEIKRYHKFAEPTVVAVGQTHERMFAHLLAVLHEAHSSVLSRIFETVEVFEKWSKNYYFKVINHRIAIIKSKISEYFYSFFFTDPRKVRRRAAAEILGKLGDAQAMEGLLAALHDPDSYVREQAATALGKLGDAQAMEGLLAALYDDTGWYVSVRMAVAKALGKLGDVRAVDVLLAELHDWDEYDREQAARALGRIGDARAVEDLLDALHDVDEVVRQAAAKALGQIGDVRAVEGLLAELDVPDGHVRQWAAAEALGEIGDARAVDVLLDALHDEDEVVRQAAAEALGEIGDARAMEGLLVVLHDSNWMVKRAAATALGKFGDVQGVDVLLAMLHDPNRLVRVQASEALGQIGDARAANGLLAALHDGDRWVRRVATIALGKIVTLDVLEKLLHHLDIDIYDENIFPVARRLTITFSRHHPLPACLPAYPQPLFLRLLKKGFWWMRILRAFLLNVLRRLSDELRQKRR